LRIYQAHLHMRSEYTQQLLPHGSSTKRRLGWDDQATDRGVWAGISRIGRSPSRAARTRTYVRYSSGQVSSSITPSHSQPAHRSVHWPIYSSGSMTQQYVHAVAGGACNAIYACRCRRGAARVPGVSLGPRRRGSTISNQPYTSCCVLL
jgi:hypothetical protein